MSMSCSGILPQEALAGGAQVWKRLIMDERVPVRREM